MIVADEKPIKEVLAMVKDRKKVLVVGCGSCVSICFAGGEREAELLADALGVASAKDSLGLELEHGSVLRQCEWEFNEPLKDRVSDHDCVVSVACGVGVQTMAEQYPDADILPGLNTTFMGMPRTQGVWEENCVGCGSCLLSHTGGVCPIARCAKNLLNGPCGGASPGRCEVSEDVPCAWEQIHDVLKAKGRLSGINYISEGRDWSASMAGSPRKRVRPDLTKDYEQA